MLKLVIIIGIFGWVAFFIAMYAYIRARKSRLKAIYEQEKQKRDPKVVVIGGGTGQSIFLRGLKNYTKNITAVVTVADDGGGSGVLREDLGMLPPGDIRNCLLALADIEPTMNEVMNYRFTEGGLKGQSFGNLFLAAMNGIYGNFEVAIYKMSEIFAITGKVLPVTLTDVSLIAHLKNGKVIRGESIIPKTVLNYNTEIERISLEPSDVEPLEDVITSIKDADVIVIGPGSLYTSIMPNLVVRGVVEAIKESNAPKVYISNVMTQPGETDGYNTVNHIKAIQKHTKSNIIDYIISNNKVVPEKVFEKYKKQGSEMVLLDKEQKNQLDKMGVKTIEDDLLETGTKYIKHNANKISKIVVDLALSHRNDRSK